jgi:TPR repeat protein
MKKIWMTLALALLPCLALADELADAVKAWEKRDFATAYQGFTRLANAGNPQAQQLLGEMYGFGEGVPEDPARARQWLEKSRAAGNQEAAASLQLLEQRGARKADIARYSAGQQWTGVSLSANGCARPVFPEVSIQPEQIKALSRQVSDYRACYDKFVDALPARKVPDEIANLMSLTELAAARAADDAAMARVATEARAEATAVIAANDAWVKRSTEYATGYNLKLKAESDLRQRQIDEATRRVRDALGTAPVIRK